MEDVAVTRALSSYVKLREKGFFSVFPSFQATPFRYEGDEIQPSFMVENTGILHNVTHSFPYLHQKKERSQFFDVDDTLLPRNEISCLVPCWLASLFSPLGDQPSESPRKEEKGWGHIWA